MGIQLNGITGDITTPGDVGIGGTLTYEDVTNIDSVGLITARSGLKIGPTAGVAGTFFADGSYVTAGIVTAATFHGDGSALTGITQVGGATGADFNDNIKLRFGTGNDLEIFHDASHSRIHNNTGLLLLECDGTGIEINSGASTENMAKFLKDGAVELYHNNVKTAWTHGSGFNIKGGNTSDNTELIITGNEGQPASILMSADDGDDNADHWRMYSNADNSFTLNSYAGGSYQSILKGTSSRSIELNYQGSKKLETTSSGAIVTGSLEATDDLILSGANANLRWDKSDDALEFMDQGKAVFGSDGDASVKHSGSDLFITNSTGGLNIKCDSGTGVGEGVITFSSGTGTEGMRMSSNQNIFIHSTNNSGSNGRIYTNGTNGGTLTVLEVNQNAGSGAEMITLRNNGSQLGTIHQSGSGVNYQSNSDYRLKENDVVISDGIARIKQLRPIRFNWKADTDTTVDGFFAHEVSPVVPESVRGKKDETFDTDGIGTQVKGGAKYQQLDQSKLVPLLTAALKESITKIETLESKVAALEGS